MNQQVFNRLVRLPNITAIIEEHGGFAALADPDRGFYIKVQAPGFMPLVIEDVRGLFAPVSPVFRAKLISTISVAHYGEQNGDLMRDPEVVFEVIQTDDGKRYYVPIYFRNDYVGIEQFVRFNENMQADLDLMKDLAEFAVIWDTNIGHQGFKGQQNLSILNMSRSVPS